jgi:nitrite reductase (NADH) large subunit
MVGNGMAGMSCLEQILAYRPDFESRVFGDETHVNYNRVLLSSVLAGEKRTDEIVLHPLEWYRRHGLDLRLGVRIVNVDPVARTVTGDDGAVTPYDRLLLATGSSAWRPPIAGLDTDGVFTFRTLDDTRALIDRSREGARAVVIGGGLLGLEAARGLQIQGCRVTVVHVASTLMERQLDDVGGSYLQRRVGQLGIDVLLGRTTAAVLGGDRVTGVAFSDGSTLDADLVVLAAGIRPNAELGRLAGVTVNRGIVVNDYMETSSPDVFAVGECVEHRGTCYGLIAPLIEQGKVLAATITGRRGPTYEGTVPGAKLKIAGVDVFSAGAWDDAAGDSIRYEDSAQGVYRRIVVRDRKLAGLILVGDAADSHRYMDWLRSDADIPVERRQLLFPGGSPDAGLDAAGMSENAVVCGCVGVTKGALIRAVHDQGVHTLSQLKDVTRASTGCGSCTKLCQDLLRAVAPEFEEESTRVLCACVPFPEEKLREIL